MLKNFTRSVFIYGRSLFVLMLLNAFTAQAQTPIARWNFNNSSLVPSTGAGTLSLLLPVTSSYLASGAEGGAGDKSLSTATYPLSGSTAKKAGIELNVSTIGYNGIHLKYFRRHTSTAARKVVVQYFDGSVWQDFYSYIVATVNNFNPQIDIDFSSVTSINNNGSARFRIVTDTSNGNNYEATTTGSTYGSAGAIHYDVITIIGNTLSCISPATQQASGLRLLKTDATSAQLTLNRGDGGGCLVLCSNTGIPSAPVNNTIYSANAAFGSGATLGNSFAVYNTQVSNPAIQYFNINNLVAGTKYYVAAYEYSSGGNCYLPTAFVDSFYCNSTVLYPGDVQFVGYDNNDSAGGRDFFVMTNLAPLKKGTTFQIVNARYEAGAAANERTNRWYAGGNNIHQNLQRITVTYTGDSLPAGSILSFSHLPQSPANIKINSIASSNLIITDNLTIGNLLSGTGAEQLYITQGRFTSYGSSSANNQYSVLNGHVLHGFSYDLSWVDFSQLCDSGTIRHSRVPPDITSIKLFFNTSGVAYFNTNSLHTGTQGVLVSEMNNSSRWTIGTGTNLNDIIPAVLATTFTPNRMNVAGSWTGNANDNNWFNSLNWEGLSVPDFSVDAIIPTAKVSIVNASAPFADLYNRVASTRSLTIVGTLTLGGLESDKLVVYDSLLVDTTGQFSAFNINSNGIDSIILKGNLERRNGANVQAFENSVLSFDGNPMLRPNNIKFIKSFLYKVRTLTINNLPGVLILNGDIETVQQIELNNGILSVIDGQATFYLSQDCNIISSSTNMFGENKGWEKSFIDGRVNIRTSNMMDTLTAPIGSSAKNIFAPMVFITNTNLNVNNRIYSAQYVAASHPSVSPSDVSTPPLDHVSELEYWTLNSPNPAAAKVTLYYTPYSRVSGVGNTAQALQDLRVVQYWDSISSGTGTNLWRYPGAGSHTVTGDSNYGRIAYNDYATDLSFSSQNFTLGTISRFNTLPVQLLTWRATPQIKQVRLTWQVADESDVNFYTIEKSTDGVHYTDLQKINKATNAYATFDTRPADGWNYYRLKATGTDGKIFYSDIQKVWFASAGQWVVYPNPVTDILWLQLPTAGTVTLYTMDGKIMLQRKLPASLNKLPLNSFAKGLYLLEYFDGKKRQSQKINLQ